MQYQWIKGERLGEIEVLDKTDEEWVYFSSGRRISSTLMSEYMLPINEYDKPMNIPGQVSTSSYSFQSEDDDKTIRDAEGNVYTPPSPVLENKRQPNRQVQPINEEPKRKEINPIQLLLNQASKDEIDVSIDIKIKIPKKAVYALISESFDTDIDKQIKEMVSEDINFEKMKQVILESVDNTIKNYYKSK
jgi:hypothetical protein